MTRADLVGLALLLGCDYCPQGVPGVGKEGALKLLKHCNSVPRPPSSTQGSGDYCKSWNLLELFRVWRRGSLLDQTSSFEEKVQRYVFPPYFITKLEFVYNNSQNGTHKFVCDQWSASIIPLGPGTL